MERDVKRDARTELGAARIARTEASVIAAARELFLEYGYPDTTLTEVARRAGVAPRTVYVRFGSKAALFIRVIGQALTGDAEPVDVANRPRSQDAMTAATLHERLDALIEVSVGIMERVGALFEVAAQAEGSEPDVAKAARAGRHETAQLCSTFWARAAEDGLLHPSLDPAVLATTTDVLLCADTVVHLRRTRDWSATEHEQWLQQTLRSLIRA